MKKGFTLIEMIIYVSIISMAFGIFVNVILSINRSYGRLSAKKNLDEAAMIFMERILRETRSSTDIDTEQSVFNDNSGKLVLNQKNVLGEVSNVSFFVNNLRPQIERDGVLEGDLTSTKVESPKLIFRLLDSGTSKGIKIEVEFKTKDGAQYISEVYYGFAVLRGSY